MTQWQKWSEHYLKYEKESNQNIEMKYGPQLNRFANKIQALANFSRQIMSPVGAPPLPK